MKAVILAAGRGSRMGDLTSARPKCRTRIWGKELLEWQLSGLKAAGIQNIGLVRGYLADTFTEDLRYFENPAWASTNMVASLECCAEWLEEGQTIISYSDIIYGPGTVKKLIEYSNADISITYDPAWLTLWQMRFANPCDDAESFKLNENGELRNIGETVEDLSLVQGQYMGLLGITPNGWRHIQHILDELPASRRLKLDMTSLLQLLLSAGIPVQAIPVEEDWYEVDSEQDLVVYQQHKPDGPDFYRAILPAVGQR